MKNFLIANWFKVTVATFLLVTTASASYYFVAKTKPPVVAPATVDPSTIPVATDTASAQSTPVATANTDSTVPVPIKTVPTIPIKAAVSAKTAPVQVSTTATVPVSVPVPAPVTVVASTAYDEQDFYTDLGNIYYPFNKQFFVYYNNMVTYVNKGDMASAKGFLNSAKSILATTRGQITALKAKYPKITPDDFLPIPFMTTATNNMYLNLQLYSSVINSNIIDPAPELTDDQIDQIVYNSTQAASMLQEVHDFLSLHQ